MAAAAPVVAVLFLLPALSLAGIPPFSGFAAKFGLFDATARAHEWPILAIAVIVSLLTLFSIFKIWIAVFWAPRQATAGPAPVRRAPCLMVVPTAVLAVADACDRPRRRTAVPLQRPRRRRPASIPPEYRERRAAGGGAVRSLGAVLALALIWVLLWGTASAANVLSGLPVGTLLVLVVPGCAAVTAPGCDSGRSPSPASPACMLVTLVRSNVELTRTVLRRHPRWRTAIVGVPLPDCADEVITLLTNLLALSPGTMPIELRHDPVVLYVHIMQLDDPRRCATRSCASPTSPCGRSAATRRSLEQAAYMAAHAQHARSRVMTAAAYVLLLVATALFLVRLLRGPSLADRVIGIDGMIVCGICMLIVRAMDSGDGAVPPGRRRARPGVVHQHLGRRPLHRRARAMIGELIVLVGAALVLAAAIGVLRFADVLTADAGADQGVDDRGRPRRHRLGVGAADAERRHLGDRGGAAAAPHVADQRVVAGPRRLPPPTSTTASTTSTSWPRRDDR